MRAVFSRACLFIVFLVFSESCSIKNARVLQSNKTGIYERAAVVSAHPEASRIGLMILKEGGNAVDAAIAVQFALAVCYPVAGNIGGGGFMIYRDKNGNTAALDFREKAPGLAHETMFQDADGNVISEKSKLGHLAAGVPGTVDGMVTAFQKFSKLKDWKKLIQPSVDLARKGFGITAYEARIRNKYEGDMRKVNNKPVSFIKDEQWKEGDLARQEELAQTLERIRDDGRAGFYEGKTAELIVAEMKDGNGLISLEDLKAYKSAWRTPVVSDYDNLKIISMPPPSSGGIALTQLLQMTEPFPLHEYGFQSAESVHVITEAERRVYADRAKHLGDADFYPVPIDGLLDANYIRERMQDFDPDLATDSDSLEAGVPPKESEQTTHFSIVDSYGNAVSLTTTLNTAYGSKVVVDGAGFILNNEMDDFSAKPGVPNYFGLLGAEANKIEPGKRMLSSMTPTIVEQDGKLKMVVGTPGGSTIITSVFQVILNVHEYGKSLKDAVHLPRFHHQWKPNKIFIEKDAFSEELIEALNKKGHVVEVRGNIGKVEAILIREDGKLEAVADIRADDDARGY